MTASRAMNNATLTSMLRWDGPVPPDSLVLSLIASPNCGIRSAGSVRLGQEAGFLHQAFMPLFGIGHPLAVLIACHESLIESAVIHQLFPVRRFAHLLEQVNIVRDRLFAYTWRHEEATQHQIFNIQPLRLAGRDVVPRHVARDLVLVVELLAVEHAEWPQLAGAPVRHRLDRV